MNREETVVIGAGLTGLSFAYHSDPGTPIYEKETRVGGMVRTIDVEGYKFDLAPHLLHLRSDYVKELVFGTLGLRTTRHQRRARIFFDGKIIPYPFELNLYELDEQVRRDCLDGLAEVNLGLRGDDEALRRGSYRDYALNAFGSGIARHYLLPYNRKIWDTDPADMTCEWMRFLPTADVHKIVENAGRPNTDSFGYNTEFHYPLGGIQELADVFAARLDNLHLGREVVGVDPIERILTFTDGERVGYEQLVSTMPLRHLAEITGLAGLASRLVNTRVYTINVVIRGAVPEGVHWMYFPDPTLPFYRVSFPKNYFDGSTPADEHIIAVEVGSRGSLPTKELEARVVEALGVMDIFRMDEVVFVHSIPIPVAYCIYDHDRTALVEELTEELRGWDIHSVGRYGFWEYSAMEDAILYGRNLALELDALTPDVTE